ncbi:MAG: hypothetical protein AAF652_20580 [Cyanobacteria bacterium P01_C01_bin.72]
MTKGQRVSSVVYERLCLHLLARSNLWLFQDVKQVFKLLSRRSYSAILIFFSKFTYKSSSIRCLTWSAREIADVYFDNQFLISNGTVQMLLP